MKLAIEHPTAGLNGNVDAPWKGRVFGITVASTFPIPGAATESGRLGNPDTRVSQCSAADLARIWRRGTGTVLEELRQPSGRLGLRLSFDPGLGYLFNVPPFGAYLISADGGEVLCAPPQRRPYFWERFIMARALPYATVLRGHEALHASAVDLAGRGLAFLGDRGHGKTSIAVHLALHGATILTDDVVALDREGPTLLAHPGAALISVRRTEFKLLSAAERAALGTSVGRGAKVYVTPRTRARPLPLSAVYFLARGATADGVRIEHLSRPDPRWLLAASFVSFVQAPDRLARQLDVCAALAVGVPVFRIDIPNHVSAREVAAAVVDQAETLPKAVSR